MRRTCNWGVFIIPRVRYYVSVNLFTDAEKARADNCIILIHCMAGVSRSVTLTIAYLMKYFGLSMQAAYQLVKDKRPAISPNLNFMGQLVAFEQELNEFPRKSTRKLSDFNPSDEQEKLTEDFQDISQPLAFGDLDKTPSPKAKLSPGSAGSGMSKFVLKLPIGNRKAKKLASVAGGKLVGVGREGKA
jgi:hypothetical protein